MILKLSKFILLGFQSFWLYLQIFVLTIWKVFAAMAPFTVSTYATALCRPC